MSDKRKKAQYLFDEIGNIDDRYISSAQNARGGRVKIRRAVMLIAAVLILTVAAFAVLPLSRGSDKENENILQPEKYGSMDDVLRNSSDKFLTAEVDLFSGENMLVWRENGGRTYSMHLSQGEYDRLSALNGKGVPVSSYKTDYMVWFTDGRGNVTSPYLEKSDGNTVYGRLFDYAPEIIPTEEITALIAEIMVADT